MSVSVCPEGSTAASSCRRSDVLEAEVGDDDISPAERGDLFLRDASFNNGFTLEPRLLQS